jgi:hypothetical protein
MEQPIRIGEHVPIGVAWPRAIHGGIQAALEAVPELLVQRGGEGFQ